MATDAWKVACSIAKDPHGLETNSAWVIWTISWFKKSFRLVGGDRRLDGGAWMVAYNISTDPHGHETDSAWVIWNHYDTGLCQDQILLESSRRNVRSSLQLLIT